MKNKTIGILIIIVMLAIVPTTIFAYGRIDTNVAIGQGGAGAITSSIPMTERILGAVQVAGSVISVIALIIIGMRYMFSSIEDKAQMKGVIGYYITGCVLVFATSNVLGFAYDIFGNVQHSYGEMYDIVYATCVKEGTAKRKCTGGGFCDCTVSKPTEINITLPINNNAHKKSDKWEITLAATCTAEGAKSKKCVLCNKVLESEKIAAIGHNFTKKDSSDRNTIYQPTTCSHGYNRYYKCNNAGCNEIANGQNSKPLKYYTDRRTRVYLRQTLHYGQ